MVQLRNCYTCEILKTLLPIFLIHWSVNYGDQNCWVGCKISKNLEMNGGCRIEAQVVSHRTFVLWYSDFDKWNVDFDQDGIDTLSAPEHHCGASSYVVPLVKWHVCLYFFDSKLGSSWAPIRTIHQPGATDFDSAPSVSLQHCLVQGRGCSKDLET